MVARKRELHHRLQRHVARSIRGERPRALKHIVGIDHAAVIVAGNRKATTHVRHDKRAFLVGFAQLGGAANGAFFLIQAMYVALAIYARIARDAGDVVKLVGIGLVHGIGGLAVDLGERVQERRAQDGRVVHAGVHHVVAHRVVDGEDAAHRGAHGAAVARVGVDLLEAYALLGERVEDDLLAVVELVGRLVELGQLFGGVRHVQAENLLRVVEQGHLGGGGTRGERENLIAHE